MDLPEPFVKIGFFIVVENEDEQVNKLLSFKIMLPTPSILEEENIMRPLLLMLLLNVGEEITVILPFFPIFIACENVGEPPVINNFPAFIVTTPLK
jgi:hypothetical protein